MQQLPWQYRSLVVGLLLLACTACASKAPRLPEEAPPEPFPEVTHITFRGNTTFGSRELRKAMATKQRPLLPPWKRGEPYNPPTLEADLRRLKKFYFDRGFLDAQVRLAGADVDEENNTVGLEILVEEGAPTLVTTIHLTGTVPPELPPAPQLLAALPLRAGKPITRTAFDRSKELLLTRLQEAGYARARVVPHTEVDAETHTATVAFVLEPGDRTVFGRLTIKGAQQVNARAIRRKLTIREGQLYNAQRLTESTDAIYGLGMFQAVTPRALNFDEAEAPLDIEIEVRERKPRTVQIGFGYSTVEQFRLQVEWTHRNLFGGAQRLTLSGKGSSIEQAFETRLHLPYFLTRRTTFTQRFFVRNEQEFNTDLSGFSDVLFTIKEAQPAFDLFSFGSETRFGHQFTRRLSVAAGLQLSQNEFRNVNTAALAAAGVDIAVAEDNLLFVQFAEVLWNTSDSLLQPTQGLVVRGRLEHANAAVLSDVSFVKLVLEARHYQRLWREIILATRLELGSVQPYGASENVPFNVRFFAGGPGSVRGFSLNRLGPLDAENEPVGGNSLIEGSAELRFPIVGKFSGALFVDVGNVFREAFTYRLDALRYTVGPGVRYHTLIGPLRLDVGVIIDRRPGENFGRIEFSIGQAF
jgi:outer membrane protein assembly complex protein YaeT